MADSAIPMISSGAELAATIPSDLFTGADVADAGGADAIDTGGADSADAVDLGVPDEITVDAEIEAAEEIPPEPADETPVEAEAEAAPEPAAETASDLPDGVRRGKDSNGKDGLFVAPARWDVIYGDHKLVAQATEAIGEPLTAEAIDLRNRAYLGQERTYSDLTSGEPTNQAALLNHWFDEMARARQDGEVGIDPAVPLATTFYSTLKEKSPDGYAGLRMQAAKDLVTELYQEAAAVGDKNLWLSLNHVVRQLANVDAASATHEKVRAIAERMGIPYHTPAEMANFKSGADPLATAQQRIQALESQLNGRSANNEAAQFRDWTNGTAEEVRTSVLTDGVKAALAEDAKKGAWASNQKAFDRLVTEPLHSEVRAKLKADPALNETVLRLENEARRAVSAQIRDAKRAAIKTAYSTRARQIADSLKKGFLAEAAQTLAGQSAARIDRLKAGQTQRGPKGPGAAVPRSIAPDSVVNPGGFLNAKDMATQTARLLSS